MTWPLPSTHPSFIPRVSQSIRHITATADGSRLFVSSGDNSIVFVEATQRSIRGQIIGLRLASSMNYLYPVLSAIRFGLLFDPQTRRLLLNTPSSRGYVQVYDTLRDCGVGLLGGEKRVVSKTSTDARGSLQVDFLRCSANGDWLLMVQRWKDVADNDQTNLIWWRRIESTSDDSGDPSTSIGSPGWQVHTTIERPHHHLITAMAAHPRRSEMITGDIEGWIRGWELVKRGGEQDRDEGVTSDHWRVWSCTWETQLGGDSIQFIAYSQDGSVIAVALDQSVSLLDAASKERIASLSYPSQYAKVLFLPLLIRRSDYLHSSNTLLSCCAFQTTITSFGML